MDIEDLSGWLVPEDDVEEFEREWLSENNILWNSERWENLFRFAIWKEQDGNINIKFKEFR